MRTNLLANITPEVIAICQSLGLRDEEQTIDYLSRLWLPLALYLIQEKKIKTTFILGILGGQGIGKTTLCRVLKFILETLDFAVVSLSLDDLYLTYEERKELQKKDSRLIWRGPPGTHDIALGLQIIEQCYQGEAATIEIPRFDKSAFNGLGDRAISETLAKPDILLFEGWFVGVKPIAKSNFVNLPKPIITVEDKQFALDNNQRLQAYLPLWSKLDRLVVLYPEDYRLSKQWRQEAEKKMIASGKLGMNNDECDRFVEYFWKALHPELFIKPLLKTADLVVEIKRNRSLGQIKSSW